MRWLEEIVPTGLEPRELARRMTMAGLEAERVEEVPAGWDNVFVGLVTRVDRHPDADRLNLVDVDAGEHKLRVVTGAPNIAEGQRVALALAGARLIDPYTESPTPVYKTLKPGKIRGIVSEGMVCSERELGLSDEHEGIMVLSEDAPVGAPLKAWLGDTVIEFEITPNLVHAFSIVGIARQASALTGADVRVPRRVDLHTLPGSSDVVAVDDVDLCPRLAGAVVTGVTVGPSPEWLQRRLVHAGLRPVNNLVDITNYVMLEFGQPLHAYDRRRLAGGRIVARRARPGETLETLDHQRRDLTGDMLVIADAEKPVGVAGVMGGVDSEVADDTTEILLEAAAFDMKAIRRSRTTLRLRTDASARFERGLDPNLPGDGIARALSLILAVCPGSTVTAFQDVYPEPVLPWHVTLPVSRFERVLGVAIPEPTIEETLTRLGFAPSFEGDGGERRLTVTVPTERRDVTIPEDVIEEVARVVGYDTLPETLPSGRLPAIDRALDVDWQRAVRRRLAAAGASECISYPTVGAPDLASLSGGTFDEATLVGVLDRRPAVDLLTLVNPIQAERPYLRNTLVPSLLALAAENRKHETRVALFEVGSTFRPVQGQELPDEVATLALVMSGARAVTDRFAAAGTLDYFDAKGVLESALGVDTLSAPLVFVAAEQPLPFLHPGRTADLRLGDRQVGVIGELRPDVARSVGFEDARVAVAEVDLRALFAARVTRPTGKRVPRFLPAQQDFAIVVDRSVSADAVRDALAAGAGALATGMTLFDVFEGEQIGADRKSLAWRVTFEAPDRALTDAELVKTRSRIAKVLKQRVDGVLRG
ncbi:MAG: Phenylalanyl-tRNA synthetase beta chain [uncultured Thermomicrobiales bacterium]|uniref:Phenylalanine--tRNA ligase beta subunit n=1 Tax=uncultured Thermomicrobiales bacterium TaxID=1645740 RepID=A0A6J4VDY4_9BACT|nr:MAG: Phenylalanyl-tRNA synthetase beta chain [uncultured Thermomicrobiales bacterium]